MFVYTTVPITPSSIYYDSIPIGWPSVTFNPGSMVDTTGNYLRFMTRKNLDFMWQHYAPHTNMIDPSASNIHDAFILTSGYYNNVISYIRGLSTVPPVPPTPLELRQSYGYLLENKMLSDTIVLHSGKIRLLFGELAEPQLRARFKVVIAPTAKLSTEVIKQEVLNVINTYFDISNWDFGNSFYATELIALIHQRLPTEISSVVLVPVFSTNSFGSLFTVQCGMDEILQSAAKITDIEIVADLTRDVLRQGRLT
jgi:septum formation topological specificity factor MinE